MRKWLVKQIRKLQNLFSPNCPSCKKGYVRYIGDDYINTVWLTVYECDHCKEKFI